MEYNFFADALNKFSQFTPVIQAVIVVSLCCTLVGLAYVGKEVMATLVRPLIKDNKKVDTAIEGKQ